MTIVTNAQATGTVVSIREQLDDLIYNIDPQETPFISNAAREKATNVKFEWLLDILAAATANAQLEGDQISAAATTQPTRLNNQCQISYKSYAVTETARVTNQAGRADELVYQRMRNGLGLRRDMEVSILANQSKIAASGTSTARKTAGLPSWITQGTGFSTTPTGDGSDTVAAVASTTMTYTDLATCMRTAYESGGMPTLLMLSPKLKVSFSSVGFAAASPIAITRYNLPGAVPSKMIGAVEAWVSDFGTIDVVVNRQMASAVTVGGEALNSSGFFLDPRYYSLMTLRDIQVQALAKTGDADTEYVVAEYGLKVRAPKAHAAMYART